MFAVDQLMLFNRKHLIDISFVPNASFSAKLIKFAANNTAKQI